MARMLRGQPIADKILIECGVRLISFKEQRINPSLTTIFVGNDKAASYFAEHVRLSCIKISMDHHTEHFGENVSLENLIDIIEKLNEDPKCHGIHLALPFPEHINALALASSINTNKDVGGLHPTNLGLLFEKAAGAPVSCDAKACMQLIEASKLKLPGKLATVLGDDWVLGRPMAAMLTNAGATVTLTRKDDPNMKKACRSADVLVVCDKTRNLVNGSMIKPQSVVVDAGINYREDKFIGGVDLKTSSKVAKYLGSIPGSFELLSVAHIINNTLVHALRTERSKRKIYT